MSSKHLGIDKPTGAPAPSLFSLPPRSREGEGAKHILDEHRDKAQVHGAFACVFIES